MHTEFGDVYENEKNEAPGTSYPVKSLKLAGNDISLFKVILPPDAIPSEQTAAAELIKYIALATGAKPETAESAEYAIILRGENDGELGRDGFSISFEGKNLVVRGGRPRGVMYGAYTFLEKYVGCRYYTPEFEVIHKTNSIDVPAGIVNKQIPIFKARYSFWYDIVRSESQKAKLKVNQEVSSEALGGDIRYTGGMVHTFSNFLLAEKYEAERPEYFKGSKQICLLNLEILKIAIAYVRNLLEENPDAMLISVSQNDNEKYCKCPACLAAIAEEGTPMGPLLKFVNAVARDIAKDYPNVLIDTLAYQYTRKAPLSIKPEPNVQIRLCSIECGFSSALDDPACSKNAAFMNDLRAWGEIASHLSIWDYTTNFCHYCAPFPNYAVLRENARIFAEHGADSVFEQGTWNFPSGEFGELRGYLIAKLLWNPLMSKEEYYALMDEFLKDYYGAGWENIRAYIDFMIGRSKISTLGAFDNPAEYASIEELPMIDAWWNAAKSVATAEQLERLEKSYTQILKLKVCYYMNKKAYFNAQYSAAKEIYDQYRHRFGLAEDQDGVI